MSQQSLISSYASNEEVTAYQDLTRILEECPIPSSEILANLSLFIPRSSLAHLLFMHELYRRILTVHGVIVEFGVRWGRNLALFIALRTIYETHNFSRKIIGFDTFEGFPAIAIQDGHAESATIGSFSVTPGYENYLERLLSTHEKLAPRSHLKKFELVKGDVCETLPQYLNGHPETIIALAYFDLDLYEPTMKSLERIKNHLTKGSVIGFDELNYSEYPGETLAFQEVFGSLNYQVLRNPIAQYQSYIVIE